MALAEKADVELLLGRTLTEVEAGSDDARIDGLLTRASAIFKAATRQNFASGDESTIVRALNGRIRLTQRPVVAITSVQEINLDGTAGPLLSGWTFDGIGTVDLRGMGVVINAPEWRNGYPRTIAITYRYGYDTIPEDVIGVVAGMVSRFLNSPAVSSPGVISETIGNYSYRLADGANAGDVGFTESDQLIIDKYRVSRTGTVELHP